MTTEYFVRFTSTAIYLERYELYVTSKRGLNLKSSDWKIKSFRHEHLIGFEIPSCYMLSKET